MTAPFLDLIDSLVLQIFPARLAYLYQAVPVAADKTSITLACAHSLEGRALEELRFALDLTIHQVLIPEEKLISLLEKNYAANNKAFSGQQQPSNFLQVAIDRCEISEREPVWDSNATPIIRYVNLLLDHAIKTEASDLHLELFETECKIRCRIDGTLHEMKPLPPSLALPIISRMKLLAHLDITERRLPQDGRLQRITEQASVDFRLSTLPTQFGESLVLRLLDRHRIFSDLKALQLPIASYEKINTLLHKPHGLFIVTGPTGAGKTTTLYACLQELNARGLKLLTAEDPVEYEIEGLVQVPIEDSIGRTFQCVLRSFLRHDPDVIMIGETRDPETAQMAMQASLTGHLVFTTLHTNDAPGALARLIDMGVDPLMISTTLEGVLAQRLVRKICLSCRAPYQPAASLLAQLKLTEEEIKNHFFYHGCGCHDCQQTGYRGRAGIFELLLINDALRLLINQRAPHHELRAAAIKSGMTTLHADGLRLIFEGITTVEEVLQASEAGRNSPQRSQMLPRQQQEEHKRIFL